MAEGSATQKKTADVKEQSREGQAANPGQAEKERNIKELFRSPQWYYPVHKYIGDVVRGQFTKSMN